MVAPAASLIGLDWGSTSLRAWLIGADGKVLAQRASHDGSMRMNGAAAAYAAALAAIAGDWIEAHPAVPLLGCGMVGSHDGWCQAPYVDCPAGAEQIVGRLVRVERDGARGLVIVPGLACRAAGSAPDVMRGEETQIVGALALRPELAAACTFILPGTHSKWTRLAHGRVLDFATYMTGELYAVLRTHSVLGRLMAADAHAPDPVAFEAGVRAARDGAALAHQLFAVRSLGLSGELAPQALPGYLSGLLIGHEVGAALAGRTGAGHDGAPLALVGESALCALYQHALRLCGGPAALVFGNTAPAGLWQLALGAGLVPGPRAEAQP